MNTILAIFAKIGLGKMLSFILGGVVLSPLIIILKNKIADNFEEVVDNELKKLFNPNIEDPQEKKLIVDIVQALVNYAEYKLPDKMGKEKFMFVKTYLEKFIPEKYANEIVDLIEECVQRLNDELKKNVK
jgi:RNAse (barnase) inhibitor barstar